MQGGLQNKGISFKDCFSWSFKVNLRTTRKIAFCDSPSHNLEKISENDEKTLISYSSTEDSTFSKDFIFNYTTEDFHLPSFTFGKTDATSTAILSFIPKFCQLSLSDAFRASLSGESIETDVSDAKGEFIFLLDRSGSMGGQNIQKAKQALVFFLKSLPQDTYFNVVSFGSTWRQMFKESQKYTDEFIDITISQVKAFEADMGGT